MKKSIIVIALALLMIVPVFAGDANPVRITSKNDALASGETPLASSSKKTTTTDVTLSLTLKPIYYTAITTKDVTATTTPAITKENYTESVYNNVAQISMTINEENWTLNSNSSYYLSYFFYQNSEDVTLNVAIDNDLTTTATGTTYDDDADGKGHKGKNTIAYSASFVTGKDDNGKDIKTTIYSNTENSKVNNVDIVSRKGSRQMDNKISESYKMTIAPLDGEDLKSNIAGYYKSTITLSLINK